MTDHELQLIKEWSDRIGVGEDEQAHLPSDRPKCPMCNEELRPILRQDDTWTGEWNCYGYFCSQRCAGIWAHHEYEKQLRGEQS